MLDKLRSEIRSVVESCCDAPDFCESILQVLSRSDFALHPEARCTAGILTLKICESISGTLTNAAFKVAVAVELYMEAGVLFDNVADQELETRQNMGVAGEMAIAIGLMSCGAKAACEAGKQMGSDSLGLNLMMRLQKDCLAGCSGQFLDGYLQKHDLVSTDEALEMTCRKSGSLGRSAATLGAIVATEDSGIIDLFAEFGFNLFTYLQLLDDLRDACPSDGYMRDLEQHKKTLPLTYFYNYLAQEYTGPDSTTLPWECNRWSVEDIRREYSLSGANMFCAIVAETFLNRAKSILETLRGRIRTVASLERYVSSMEIIPDEVLEIAKVS